MEEITDWSNKRLFTTLTVTIVLVCGVCIYTRNLQDHYDKAVTSEHCTAELEAAKHQLEVVMEYKDRTDKLLADTQRYHDIEKDRFKDVMGSCFAMTQQSITCQNQLDGLQMRCKKTRADCAKIAKELDELKSVTNSTEMS